MVSAIRIYVEGGGDRANTKQAIREGFGEFLRELRAIAGRQRIGWYIVACGGREQTFDAFQTVLKSHPEAFNILLVDAEGPVKGTPWQYLRQRDAWNQPDGTHDDQCHLMVQTMETWLIADRATLQRFYGSQGFNLKALPRNANVEDIDKETVVAALEHATRNTSKEAYHKIRHGPKILAVVDARTVCAVAPHCARLFTVLREKLSHP